MAGAGPAPKRDAARRNKQPEFTKLVAGDAPMGWDLPDDVLPQIVRDGVPQVDRKGKPIREQWHPQTKRWWEHWRTSPQASRMLSQPDWDFLLDTALMHHIMWSKARWEFAAELRLRAAKFGATPEDRMRLRSEIAVPDEYPIGDAADRGGASVTDIRSRRKRIAGGAE